MNIVQQWLALIDTPERAQRLLDNLWQLDGKRHRGCGGKVRHWECTSCHRKISKAQIRFLDPPPDPIAVLDGDKRAQWLYAQQDLTAAFDAWDAQHLTAFDMMHLAKWIIGKAVNSKAAA